MKAIFEKMHGRNRVTNPFRLRNPLEKALRTGFANHVLDPFARVCEPYSFWFCLPELLLTLGGEGYFQRTREGCGCFWGHFASSGGKFRENSGKIKNLLIPLSLMGCFPVEWNLTAIQRFPGSFRNLPRSSPNFPGSSRTSPEVGPFL